MPHTIIVKRLLKVEAAMNQLIDACEDLLIRCEESDNACYYTLSTGLVRDTLQPILQKVKNGE